MVWQSNTIIVLCAVHITATNRAQTHLQVCCKTTGDPDTISRTSANIASLVPTSVISTSVQSRLKLRLKLSCIVLLTYKCWYWHYVVLLKK